MTDELAVRVLRAIREHADLELSDIIDAGRHGADAGWAGFTWYGDTSDFYRANEGLLWELLAGDADEYGADSIPAFVASFNRAGLADDRTGWECLVSWYALESAGHWLGDRRDCRELDRG